MPNIFTTKVAYDTNKRAGILITGKFDGASGGEANTNRIWPRTLLNGAINSNNNNLLSANGVAKAKYNVAVERISYTISPGARLELNWGGDQNAAIVILSGSGTLPGSDSHSLKAAPYGANANGNVGVTTVGVAANTGYSLFVELSKDAADWHQGQFSIPSDFNR